MCNVIRILPQEVLFLPNPSHLDTPIWYLFYVYLSMYMKNIYQKNAVFRD